MRSLILSLVFISMSAISFGQASETCLAAEGSPEMLAAFPHTELITIDPLWINDTEYIPPVSPAGALSVAYWTFSITTPDYYSIDLQTTGGATIVNDVSVGLSDGTVSACPMDANLTEIYSGMLMVASTVSGQCTFLTPGTYTMAFAVAQGDEGDIEVIIGNSIMGASNDNCAGAIGLPSGMSVGDNSCSDGLVWFSYTVVNGGSVSISVSDAMGPNSISNPVITQAITDIVGCGGPDDGVTSWTCLPPTTVIYFEAGDNTTPVEEGDFNINITDDPTGLPNELCTDVTPVAAPSCVSTELTDVTNNTTSGACPESVDFGGCGVFTNEATVWFAFDTDANAETVDIEVTNGSITASTFVLFDGSVSCPSSDVAIGGCQTGMMLDQVVTPNTTYYIAVATSAGGTDGTFTLTVTPEDPPANDDCTLGAEDITASAATGVDGTTACATSDINDFCAAASEDHVVYYTYTVDASILGNRDVTFTFTTNTNTTGTAATGLFFGLFEDCMGTAVMNTPNPGEDPCDALTGTVTYECVQPATTFTIAVGSEDMTEGDFNIQITESDLNVAINDLCDAPTPLMPGQSCVDIDEATDNTNGCPEVSDLGSTCSFSSDLVVWYSLMLPADATGIDFTDLSAGAQMALFQNDCPTLTIVDDCFTGNIKFTGLTGGNTYLLAVSQTLANEGPVTFTWSPQAIPTNDDCDLGTNPDILLETNGTTGCATYDFNTCSIADPVIDHQVFYTYTNTMGANVDLEITIEQDMTNSNPATQVSITVLDDNCAAFTFFYPTQAESEWCDILGLGMQTIPCIEDGETIVLVFSSVDGEEGDFTIVANAVADGPTNDECTGAEDITPPTCVWTMVSGLTPLVSAENACPEDFLTFPAGCDFTSEATVWYSITVPNDGLTYTLDVRNITDDAFLTIFESTGADCDSYGTPSINADCETGAGPHGDLYTDLTNGATYFIAVGDPTPTGGFDFEIRLNQLPSNDECVDADAITAGMLTLDGTTSCATQPTGGEYASGACPPTDQTNTVFYTYEVPPTDKGFHVTITAALTDGFTGDVNLVVFEDDPAGSCATGAGATSVEDDACTTSGTLNEQYECVGPGTYVIRIATSDDNAGDFQITITPIALVQPNDNCDAANNTDLNPGLECTWQTATANTMGACPEDPSIDPGNSCGLSADNPTVWYEVTAPATANFLDLQINSDGGSNPFIAVFPGNPVDCAMQAFVAGSSCYEGIFDDLDALGQTQIPVTGGNTYLIAVGASDPAGVMFEFGIRWITPPLNDDCAPSGPGTGAVALTGGTPTDGTTACATQPIGGEYNSGVCTDDDETNSVFYTYEVPASDKGFHVTISAVGFANPFTGDVNIVVFEDDPAGSCATGPGATAVEEVCTSAETINEEFECVGEGTYVIRIATSSDNEGEFSIEITPIVLEQPNDNCDAADNAAFAAALECEWMVIDANTTGACPEDMNLDGPNCGLDDFPVTWYEATAPANAEFLDLQINFGGLTPFVAVFEQGPDCDNLTYVAGSTCYAGTFDELDDLGEDLIDITPGSTYLIAIGTDINAGATVNFGIKWITPPDNDECVDAEVFDALTPSGDPGEFSQTLTMETTQCATEMFVLAGTDCDENNTNTVWYTYTVEPDVKEITIDVLNYMPTNGGVTNFSIYVSDACPDAGGNITLLNQADGTPATYCGGEGEELIKLSCIDEGTTITFSITSSSDNEGTFDVTLNTAEPNCTYTNDECVDAAPLTGNPDPLITDDPNDCVLVPGCNDLACSDFNFGACAGIDQLNAVFFTFTTDANVDPVDGAFVNIEILNGEPGELDAPGAVLFEGGCVTPASIGACGAGAGGEYNSGPLGGPGFIQPNTTYTIMVFNSDPNQNGGTFDLCVTVTSGCVNDDICDAFVLEPGVTVDNPASSVGCTPDFTVTTGCDPTLENATLWYQIDVPEGAASIEITLNNLPDPDGVDGEVSIAVGPLEDCNNFDPNDVLYDDCTGFGTGVHEIPCIIEYGTYWIQIGSDDEMEAGDFTITYNFNTNPDPANDICSQAEDLVVSEICEWVTFPGTLKDACPELFDLGACEYSENQAVWYTITIPAGPPTVTDMDIEIMGLATPMIGVFEFDCMGAGDPAANNGVVASTMNADGNVDCSEMALTEGIVVTEGTTYHILVSSSTNEDIPFDISIKLNAPPINDDPCINSDNPPFDLTGGGSHAGTTCCARGPKDNNPDGTQADWEVQAPCNNLAEDAAVWYMFTPDPEDDGYDIIVEGGSVSNQMTVQVYGVANPTNPCVAAPAGDEVLESSCTDLSTFIRIPNCDPTLTYFVKVTTADDDCGDFTMTVTPAAVCDYADTCDEATEALETSTQESCEDPLEFFTVPGCLELACPDDTDYGCGQTQGPTVWFKINIDDPDATKLITQIEAPGFDAVWQVFEGTSCGDITAVAEQLVIDGVTQTYPCSDSDGEPENIYQTPINPDAIANGLMYWVSVTAIGEITDPNFDFVYNSTLGCIACTGTDATDCGNGEFTAEVLENGVWVQVEDDYQFCQGIDVRVCFEFNYNTTGTGNDWIHGFVPFFGPGWDVNDDILAAIGALGNFEFFSSQGDCAPFLNGYDIPNVCTYIDDNGFLQLCNTACDPAGCPCTGSGGMENGDPLPSGFWYNTNGGSSTCGDFGCSPASFYGWPSGTNVDVSECIELKTKVFESVEECLANNSLSFGIQTFSDAVSGCWEDSSPCIVDPSVGKFDWQIECNVPPPVEGEDDEICFDGTTDIFVVTADGSPTEIQVDVIDNPNVNGENSHTFNGGSGTIMDNLTNTSTTDQTVLYVVYSVDPNLPCPGVLDTIEVLIYAELMVTFPPTSVCEGDCTTITPDIVGGAGGPYTYLWDDGQTTPSIEVCPVVPTEYTVTVTDVFGCEGEGTVLVNVNPPVELFIEPGIAVCKDDNFDPFNPDYFICVDILSASPVLDIVWSHDLLLQGQAINGGQCFAINEVTSSEWGGINMDGVYILTATVTDIFGCTASIDTEVTITGELTVIPNVFAYECGETQTQLNVTGIDAALNDIDNFFLFGGCESQGDDLDLLEEAFDVGGNWTFSVDLLAYQCYTVVAQTASGCQTSIEVMIPLSEGTPIQISGTPAVCIGSEATITVDNDGDYISYEWMPNVGNSASVTFTPDSTATYTVTTMDADGCQAVEIFEVVVNPLPNIEFSGAFAFCENGTATITASGGVDYSWTGVAGDATGPVYTTGVAGDATVTVTDANGCVSDSTITFEQLDIIPLVFADANICDGMGDTLSVPSNIINVVWEDDTPMVVSTDTFFIITGPGSFTVRGTDEMTGCDAEGSFTVSEFNTPVIMAPDTVNVCRLDSGIDSLCINFTALVSGSTGTWSQDGVIPDFDFASFPLDDVCFEGIQTGCYPFTFTTNSAQMPCENVSATVQVCVNACPCPSPATQAIPDICNLGTINLEDAVLTSDPGTWSVISAPATQDMAGLITGTTFNATGVLPGEYTVQYTLDNPGGGQCEVSSEQTFEVFEQLEFNVLGSGVLCNIEGQSFPTSMDLFDLIDTDASNGGTWVQTGTGTMLTITDGSMISSDGVTVFGETLTFEYTGGPTGTPCPPTTIEVTVSIEDCNCPVITFEPLIVCNDGSPVDLNTILNNLENLPGTWSTSSSATIIGSMFDPNGLSAGLYEVTFTLDDEPGNDCPLDYVGEVVVSPSPEVVLTPGIQPCSEDSGNGPTTVNLYDWITTTTTGTWMQTDGDDLDITGNGIDLAEVDFAGQDIGETFTFVFTTNTAIAPCVDAFIEVVITVADCECPVIGLSDPAPVCNDAGTSDLCTLIGMSEPGSFTVQDSDGIDITNTVLDGSGCILNATDLDQGTYSVIYTLDETVGGDCAQADTVFLDVTEYLSVEISEPDSLCSDADGQGITTISFNGLLSEVGLGTWSDDDNSMVAIGDVTLEASVSFVGVSEGSYDFTYTIENADPCPDFAQTITIHVTEVCNCPPILPLDPEDECNTDGPVDLAKYNDVNQPGTWSSAELTVENGNSLITEGVVAGTYTLTYTINDPIDDCPATEEVTIFVGEPANPGVAAEPYRLCEGVNEVINLGDLLEGEDDGGTWTETSMTASNGFDAMAATFTTNGESAGTYTFEYSITDNDPCPEVSSSVTVIIDANPVADAGEEKFIDCANRTALLGGTNTSSGDNIEYSWNDENMSTTSTITVSDGGIFQLVVINTATGCTDTSTVVVNKSDDLPVMTITAVDVSCFGENDGQLIISDQSGGEGDYTYQLDNGPETTDPNSFTGLRPGEYIIAIEDENECRNEYMFTITEPPLLTVDAGPDLVGELGEEFTLTIEPFDTTGVTSIVWSNLVTTEVICSGLNCTTITVTPELPVTTYYVEVINGSDCVAFDELQIRTNQIVDIVFPNIISPNGDNNNDRFYIKSGDVESVISMRVFDRWGEKLFDLENFPPRDPEFGWDGTFRGKKVVPGVYVFTVEVLFVNGDTETFSGDVTVTDSE
ncbi:MAG: gliding motility-associated C-terminal domain-containing protein [Bacteroidota bacterium]